MDISSVGGVSSVKKAELTEVTRSNGDRGFAKASSSRGDRVDLQEDGKEKYLMKYLGQQKPDYSLSSSKDDVAIGEDIENGTYEVDTELLAHKIALFV